MISKDIKSILNNLKLKLIRIKKKEIDIDEELLFESKEELIDYFVYNGLLAHDIESVLDYFIVRRTRDNRMIASKYQMDLAIKTIKDIKENGFSKI